MNPVKKFFAWMRGPGDAESAAEAQRLRDERDTIRVSQNQPSGTVFGGGAPNVPPTPDVLDPDR